MCGLSDLVTTLEADTISDSIVLRVLHVLYIIGVAEAGQSYACLDTEHLSGLAQFPRQSFQHACSLPGIGTRTELLCHQG